MALAFPSAHLRAALPPERFAHLIVEIERELDELYPPWKTPARSRLGAGIVGTRGIEDMTVKARAKWLLQRRKHLYDGHDYPVVVRAIVTPSGVTKLIAMPIVPRRRPTAIDLAAAAQRATGQASLPQIAQRLGVPLAKVEALVLDAPPGADLYGHAKRKLDAPPGKRKRGATAKIKPAAG